MPKGRHLTGGTGDVNPQTMKIRVTETGANTFTVSELAIPISRLGRGQGTTIIEVLKVWVDTNATMDAGGEGIFLAVATREPAAIPGFADARVLAFFRPIMHILTSGGSIQTRPYCYDLTDGAGHGILVATDSLFFMLQGIALAGAATADFVVLYRFKNVSITEYIGIVQSQQ